MDEKEMDEPRQRWPTDDEIRLAWSGDDRALEQVPALAERLGVKEGENLGAIDLRLKDGRSYSLMSLINALLDRMGCAGEIRSGRNPE